MNPFISASKTEAETTLAREQLHWGIFILPVLSLFLIAVPEILFIGFVSKLFKSLGGLGGGTQPKPSLTWFYAFLIFVGAMPGLVAIAAAWISRAKSEITLTNRRLIFRTGFLFRAAAELPLENVETISIFEPVLGRIFGYGTVGVTSLGGGIFPLRYIQSPQEFHSKLQQAVTNAKSPIRSAAAAPASASNDDSRYMPKTNPFK